MRSKLPQPQPAEEAPVVPKVPAIRDINSFVTDLYADFDKLKQKSIQEEDETIRKKLKRKRVTTEDTPEEPVKNRFAALTWRSVQRTMYKAQQIVQATDISRTQQIVWDQIQKGLELAKSIKSCDLPSDRYRDSTMVKTVQLRADELLNSNNISWLRKILEIAVYSKNIGYGNCQEKAFYAFAYMLKMSTYAENGIRSLRLASFYNHFILIVNEEFLMDPWLSLAFPLTHKDLNNPIDFVFESFGELVDYYSINSAGTCFTHEVREGQHTSRDATSERELPACLSWLELQSGHFLTEAEKAVITRFVSQSAKPDSLNPNRLWSAQAAKNSEDESKDKHSSFDIYN